MEDNDFNTTLAYGDIQAIVRILKTNPSLVNQQDKVCIGFVVI